MSLCDKSGRFLFEALPDIFPHGRVTMTEMELWARYYEDRERRKK